MFCSKNAPLIIQQFSIHYVGSIEIEQRENLNYIKWRLTDYKIPTFSSIDFKKKKVEAVEKCFVWKKRRNGVPHLFHGWTVWQVASEWYDWLPLC